MTIVVDSNIIASLVLPAPYTPQATRMIASSNDAGERLLAPVLFEYEIATILRRSAVLGEIEKAMVPGLLVKLLDSGVTTVVPTIALHQEALRLADRIGQSKAYDAQYLALAAGENAPFWTADRRLANSAQGVGLHWVHWIGDWEQRGD
jgi:predicted nucleic acid-binding protein